MNEQFALFALDRVHFSLTGIVRDVEQEAQVASREEVSENTPCVMAENLAIGEFAIDPRAHGAEVALADLRVDRCASELAIGKPDA